MILHSPIHRRGVDDSVEKRGIVTWRGNFAQSLSSYWPQFVDCDKRLQTAGPFLLNLLQNKSSRVLDAAMGIGCEAAFLTIRGYSVTGNEIDPDLRRIAIESAARKNIVFTVTAHDWRAFARHFRPEGFDLTLMLGNSLCLLRTQEARVEVVRNLRVICCRRGMVAVDSRNFDYILAKKEEILRGRFRYTGKTMYCGSAVEGHPISIENDCIRFAYSETRGGSTIGHLDMHPFRYGELAALFTKEGFDLVGTFSDFNCGYTSNADFHTYLFRPS